MSILPTKKGLEIPVDSRGVSKAKHFKEMYESKLGGGGGGSLEKDTSWGV